jgi:hypothetical protein
MIHMKSSVVAVYTICMYIPGQYDDSINVQIVFSYTTTTQDFIWIMTTKLF